MDSIAGFVKKSDITLFYLFNKRLHTDKLDLLMKNVTHLGSTTFSVLLSIALVIYTELGAKSIGIQMIINLSLSTVIVQSIKRIVNRPRPYITHHNIIPINPPNCKYSFPSGHTCAAFTMALVLSRSFPSLSLMFISMAILVGFSRMYLGVHYPTDITIGIVIAYITVKATMFLGFL